MTDYKHIVQYYETDKMGITHHSNYVRWMEEARIDFLSQIGWPFNKLEEEGIMSPVVGINCNYKRPTTFADEVSIHVTVSEFKGVKLLLSYEMKNQSGELVCVGESSHCFMDKDNRMLRLAKQFPGFYQVLIELVEQ